MVFVDYYAIIGVNRHATEDEIMTAFWAQYKAVSGNGETPEAYAKEIDLTKAIGILSKGPSRIEYNRSYDAHQRHQQLRYSARAPPPSVWRGPLPVDVEDIKEDYRQASHGEEDDNAEFAEPINTETYFSLHSQARPCEIVINMEPFKSNLPAESVCSHDDRPVAITSSLPLTVAVKDAAKNVPRESENSNFPEPYTSNVSAAFPPAVRSLTPETSFTEDESVTRNAPHPEPYASNLPAAFPPAVHPLAPETISLDSFVEDESIARFSGQRNAAKALEKLKTKIIKYEHSRKELKKQWAEIVATASGSLDASDASDEEVVDGWE